MYQALDTETGDFVAIKRLNMNIVPLNKRDEVEREMRLLEQFDDPHIVKYNETVRVSLLWCLLCFFVWHVWSHIREYDQNAYVYFCLQFWYTNCK